MDREKVIRAVESCFDYWLDQHRYLHQLELETVRQRKAEALVLLKEQEMQKFFVDESGKITPLPVVVQCKDCKYGILHGNEVECEAHYEIGYDPEQLHELNWFCADGERKGDK